MRGPGRRRRPALHRRARSTPTWSRRSSAEIVAALATAGCDRGPGRGGRRSGPPRWPAWARGERRRRAEHRSTATWATRRPAGPSRVEGIAGRVRRPRWWCSWRPRSRSPRAGCRGGWPRTSTAPSSYGWWPPRSTPDNPARGGRRPADRGGRPAHRTGNPAARALVERAGRELPGGRGRDGLAVAPGGRPGRAPSSPRTAPATPTAAPPPTPWASPPNPARHRPPTPSRCHAPFRRS